MALSDQDLQKINTLMSNQFAINNNSLNERFDHLGLKIDGVNQSLNAKIERINEKVDELEDRVVREMGLLKVEIITNGRDIVRLEERFEESKGAFRSLQGLVYQIHQYIDKEFTLTEDQVSKNTARIEEISKKLRLRSLNQHL